MNENDRSVVFSSSSDEYETPPELYQTLDEVFKFTLDPCSTDENHLAPKWFTAETDGLKQSWAWNRVFVNYPYSQAKAWLRKIGEESYFSDIVVLCPARTDTKGFQEYVFPRATAITFLSGRLKFANPDKDGYKPTSAPFPSCLIFYCDRENVEKVEGQLNGKTVYLQQQSARKKIIASLGGGFTSSAQMPRVLIEKYGKENIEFINCVLPNESEDTWKLFDAVEEKLGIRITYIAYDPENKWQYVNKRDRNNRELLFTPFDIFDKEGYIGNSRIDPCSRMLKRETVYNYVSSRYTPDEIVIAVGIHGDEFERHAAIKENWQRMGYETIFPIIEEPYLPRDEQVALMKEWYSVSLELYEYGFDHNNCGGACVKAGQRQWALLWYYKPDVYAEWEERELEWNDMWAEERGKEYTILKIRRDGKQRYISLKEFREEILEPAYRGESETFLSRFIQNLVANPGCMWCSAI